MGLYMSRWSSRHLNYQNMSTGDDFIHSSGLVWTFIHPECQNLSIISDSIDIPNGSKKWEKEWSGVGVGGVGILFI